MTTTCPTCHATVPVIDGKLGEHGSNYSTDDPLVACCSSGQTQPDDSPPGGTPRCDAAKVRTGEVLSRWRKGEIYDGEVALHFTDLFTEFRQLEQELATWKRRAEEKEKPTLAL